MIFIKNKYTKWYFHIIDNAKNRKINQDLYLEKHHIIPKSIGGSNDKENLVTLTPREHFICHLLLPKMLCNNNRRKMIYALWQMSGQKNKYQSERYNVTSRTYANIRKLFSQEHSQRMKSSHPFKENPETYRKLLEGIKRRGPTSKKGVKRSEKTKEKMRNKVWSEKAIQTRLENCLKNAKKRKGKKNPAHGRKIFENYVNKNKDFIIEVWKLYKNGLNKRQISLQIGASYDRVRIAVDKKEAIEKVMKASDDKYKQSI